MEGGEIYGKKIPSMRVSDIAIAVDPEADHEIVGIRSGENRHEQMIGAGGATHTSSILSTSKSFPPSIAVLELGRALHV